MLVGGAIESLEPVELFWEQKRRGNAGPKGLTAITPSLITTKSQVRSEGGAGGSVG